jgi:16S rRNA (guanine966-N2)-methyltransferase
MTKSGNQKGKRQVRIIGGRWRGRKLAFTPEEGLRPTGDRIRETLFNWLAADISGARCADLFAGSGALGLEALSRGAVHCDFVDSSSRALTQLTAHLSTLGALEQGCCHAVPAQQFLVNATQSYDIVFVDPPFYRQLVEPVCTVLEQRQLLRRNALVYIEMGAHEPSPRVPAGWGLHREKVSGDVAYRLFSIDPPDAGH